MGAALRPLVQRRAPPLRHQLRYARGSSTAVAITRSSRTGRPFTHARDVVTRSAGPGRLATGLRLGPVHLNPSPNPIPAVPTMKQAA